MECTSKRASWWRRYSNLAIVTALTLRTVFHLPLRQTEGFLAALIGLMGLAPKTPDHTSCTWALMVMDTLSLRRSPTALRGLPHPRTHRCYHVCLIVPLVKANSARFTQRKALRTENSEGLHNGGRYWARTSDPRLVKPVLLSLKTICYDYVSISVSITD